METTQAFNGEIRPGDYVIAHPDNDYGLIVGQVLAIDKLGTPEHDTDNPADDVHINFKALRYPPWQQISIAESLSETFGTDMPYEDLSIDDVIMAPDMLISLKGINEEKLNDLVTDYDEAEAFCEAVLKDSDARDAHDPAQSAENAAAAPMPELFRKLLMRELLQAGFSGAVYLPESGQIKVPVDGYERSPSITAKGNILYSLEHSDLATKTLFPMTERVKEIAAAWEHSREMPVADLPEFRVLAEYSNIILAARDDTESGYGLHFVTWEYSYDRTGMREGHYTEDYSAVKEDFAVRSGLIPKEKLITPEQAAEFMASVEFRLDNDGDLTFSGENALKEIAGKLNAAYPQKQDENLTESRAAPERATANPQTLAEQETADQTQAYVTHSSFQEIEMSEEDFKSSMFALLPDADPESIQRLIAYSDELEEYGTYPKDRYLADTFVEFVLVTRNYEPEIARQLLDICKTCFVLNAFEVRGAADFLRDGTELSKIEGLAYEGVCERSQEEWDESEAANHAFANGTLAYPGKRQSAVRASPFQSVEKPPTLAEQLRDAEQQVKAQDIKKPSTSRDKREER